eukprot:3226631-Pleurochrysis_carterae.AAC.1
MHMRMRTQAHKLRHAHPRTSTHTPAQVATPTSSSLTQHDSQKKSQRDHAALGSLEVWARGGRGGPRVRWIVF